MTLRLLRRLLLPVIVGHFALRAVSWGGSPAQPLANVCLTAQSCRNDNFISSWWAATTGRLTRLAIYQRKIKKNVQFYAKEYHKTLEGYLFGKV